MFIRCPYCGSEDVRQFFPIGSGYKCLACDTEMDASLDWNRLVPLEGQVRDLTDVVKRLEQRIEQNARIMHAVQPIIAKPQDVGIAAEEMERRLAELGEGHERGE